VPVHHRDPLADSDGVPNATIYQLSAEGIRAIAYEATEHFQVTAGFLADHVDYLRRLLTDESSAG
jgi:hypothetical protein